MHREAVRSDIGRARLDPAGAVPVTTRGTWRLTYQAGPLGLHKEGAVRVTIPHGFTTPQTKAFYDPGFTTVETSVPGVTLRLQVVSDIFCRLDPRTGHSGADGRSVFVHVEEGQFREGEEFTLVYGNADYYGDEPFSHAGAWARELSGPAEFTVAVDPDGTRSAPYSGYARLARSPALDLLPGTPVKYRAIAPSDLRVPGTGTGTEAGTGAETGTAEADGTQVPAQGVEHAVTLLVVDAFNNPVQVESRRARFSPAGVARGILTGPAGKAGEIETNPVRFHAPGDWPSDLPRDIPGDLPGGSPSGSPPLRVFWGDPHGHTAHSDGRGSLAEFYQYAKEVARLDFAAVTDHDDIGPRLSDAEWELIQAAARKNYEPGAFVPLLGHEYRNGQCDMNVYYPGDRGEVLRGTDPPYGDARELTRRVQSLGGMIVPHMHFGADWSGFSAETYRVMEVYSQHGSAEFRGCPREIPYLRKQLQKSSKTNRDCYVHEALALGHRLGLTAGSDTHCARPGFSDWTRTSRTYLGGLTAVIAPELTRQAVWAALRARRCYATTGNRSLLQFTVNGAPMGAETRDRPDGRRVVRFTCHADGEATGVTIFRSGEAWVEEPAAGPTVQVERVDSNRHQADWYYARVDLAGGEMAWSSPVWVDPLAPAPWISQ